MAVVIRIYNIPCVGGGVQQTPLSVINSLIKTLRELKFLEMVQLPPPVMCHVSCVTCHVPHVMCHMSRVTCHVSHVFLCVFFLQVDGGFVINGAYPV